MLIRLINRLNKWVFSSFLKFGVDGVLRIDGCSESIRGYVYGTETIFISTYLYIHIYINYTIFVSAIFSCGSINTYYYFMLI